MWARDRDRAQKTTRTGSSTTTKHKIQMPVELSEAVSFWRWARILHHFRSKQSSFCIRMRPYIYENSMNYGKNAHTSSHCKDFDCFIWMPRFSSFFHPLQTISRSLIFVRARLFAGPLFSFYCLSWEISLYMHYASTNKQQIFPHVEWLQP